MNLYAPSATGWRNDRPIDLERCRAQVYGQIMRDFTQCARKKVVEVDGIGYCKQHSPAAGLARAEGARLRAEEDQRRRDFQHKRPLAYRDALRAIAETTKRQQLPITSQVYTLATEALAKWNDLDHA